MKKIFYLLAIILLAIIAVNFSVSFAFSDIGDNPYRKDIVQLSNAWIVEGFNNDLFNPGRAVTRAEILKIMMEAAKTEINTGNIDCFPDVPATKRYAPYICNAFDQWIIKWYDDGSFRPENPVLFSEWLKIGLEWFKILTLEAKRWQPWFEGYLDFVHNNTIFSKYNLYPENKMSRAEMVHLVAVIINHGEGSRSNIRDNRSEWCNLTQSPVLPNSVDLNGTARHIITDIGRSYRNGNPAKLFVAFHGRTNPNSQVRGYYRVDQAGDGNTIFIYPLGLPEEWPTRSRANGWDRSTAIRDYALFDKIVEEFTKNYCVDLDEIHVIWHSLGGWMTNNLACARGNVIRSIGSVGGSVTIPASACNGPVSAIIMHNPEDNLASFAGGQQARDILLSQNKCNPESYQDLPNGPSLGHCIEYNQCLSGESVVWCPHTDDMENWTYYPHRRPSFAGNEIRNFINNLK